MAIRRTHDLPSPPRDAGRPPSKRPIIVNELAALWWEHYQESGRMEFKPAIEGLPYRASMASTRCDRAAYYQLSGAEESNPPTISDLWRMSLGQMVHDQLDEIFHGRVLPNGDMVLCKQTVDLRPFVPGSAHPDHVLVPADWGEKILAGEAQLTDVPAHAVTVVEDKTLGGFSYKMKATSFKAAPEGPSYGHILQAGMVGRALNADKAIVAYFSMEPVSPTLASYTVDDEMGRFTAEWHFSASHLAPVLDVEAGRIRRLLASVEAKRRPLRTIVDPRYPSGMVVTDPVGASKGTKGAWVLHDGGMIVDAGECWECGYCRFRDLCIDHGDDSGAGDDVSDLIDFAATTEDAPEPEVPTSGNALVDQLADSIAQAVVNRVAAPRRRQPQGWTAEQIASASLVNGSLELTTDDPYDHDDAYR